MITLNSLKRDIISALLIVIGAALYLFLISNYFLISRELNKKMCPPHSTFPYSVSKQITFNYMLLNNWKDEDFDNLNNNAYTIISGIISIINQIEAETVILSYPDYINDSSESIDIELAFRFDKASNIKELFFEKEQNICYITEGLSDSVIYDDNVGYVGYKGGYYKECGFLKENEYFTGENRLVIDWNSLSTDRKINFSDFFEKNILDRTLKLKIEGNSDLEKSINDLEIFLSDYNFILENEYIDTYEIELTLKLVNFSFILVFLIVTIMYITIVRLYINRNTLEFAIRRTMGESSKRISMISFIEILFFSILSLPIFLIFEIFFILTTDFRIDFSSVNSEIITYIFCSVLLILMLTWSVLYICIHNIKVVEILQEK